MEPTFQERVARIREERIAQDLSVRRLAKLANVRPSTIQEMDKDDWNPTLKTLVAVESALIDVAAPQPETAWAQ